jgi:hypothetical protein
MSIRHRINMGSEERPYWIEMRDNVFKEFNRLLKEEASQFFVEEDDPITDIIETATEYTLEELLEIINQSIKDNGN